MREREDDTLWTGRGKLPEDLARLEADLARLPLPDEPDWRKVRVPEPRFIRRPVIAWAMAAVFAIVAVGGQWLVRDGWRVEALSGSPNLRGPALGRRLALGGALATDEGSRARLIVAGLGRVDLEPGSVLRRVPGGRGEKRLALDHGTMKCEISAPPRLFVVETKSGVATDLGCAYTLSVDSAGTGRLAVTSGRVSLGGSGRESFVPAGAWCPLSTEGVGLPRRDYASDSFLAALAEYDRPDCASTAIDTVLARAEASDALTLWHVLPRVRGAERERVARRIAALIEVPADVPIERVLALEPAALDAWWAAVGMGPAEEWRSPGKKKGFGI
jgi:FecR-like protein